MKNLIMFIMIISAFVVFGCSSGAKVPKEGEVKTMYQCPMHPQVIQDKPGKCPICGMELVPRKMMYKEGKWIPAEEGHEQHNEHRGMDMNNLAEVEISPQKQLLIGVKTDFVKKKRLEKIIRTYGKVEYSENKVYVINAKFGGWIKKLYVDYEGKFVNKGDKLFDIYSPELYQAQVELLFAYERNDSNLLENAKKKLMLLNITEMQIEDIIKNKRANETLTFYSPYSGFIIEKKVFEGMKIEPGMDIYKIADLSEVWIIPEVYESDLPFIKKGMRAEIEIPFIPGEKFEGYVDYVYPQINSQTRTAKLRIVLKNPNFKLKPAMYANVNIKALSNEEKIVIPTDAILFSGTSNYVFVKKGRGIFEPRKIQIGPSVDDGYVVLNGLKEGEEVVISGNFLIDAESKIKSALQAFSTHQHQ